ncbi:MAG: hypothetical protein CMB73_07945 [Euryarchaeota archaeon]|nr:hypothetical protein [Euryarchaeota archaeon]|tara:strand:- start:586 stop:1605 length:1020 start_codon:yes stop_codon:yes gene_type:complete
MAVLNIAVFGSDDLCKSIAKPSDHRDVDTYVYKENGANGARILSLIRPVKYPERLRPLLNSISAARVGMIEVTGVNAALGEALVAFASGGIEDGLVIIKPPEGEWIDEDQVKMLFKQAGLANWTFEKNDGIELRNKLYDLLDKYESILEQANDAPLVIPVDQYFNVKGIGLVAIGYVQSGTLNVHDELIMVPTRGTGSAKSLQVMDDDVSSAINGDRVGVAMRNAKEEDFSGGALIMRPGVDDKKTGKVIPEALVEHKVSILNISKSPFQKREFKLGDVVHISVDLQFVVGRVQSIDEGRVTVEWDSPVFIRNENPPNAVIAQLDSQPRIYGSAEVKQA